MLIMAMSPLKHPSLHTQITGQFLSAHLAIGSITAYASLAHYMHLAPKKYSNDSTWRMRWECTPLERP
jgi:hypothetical protein